VADTTNTGNVLIPVAALAPDPFGGQFCQGRVVGQADGTGSGTILLGFVFEAEWLWLPLWINAQSNGVIAFDARLILENRGLIQRFSFTPPANANGTSGNWRVEPQPMDPLAGNLWTYNTPSVGTIIHTITAAAMRWPRNIGLNQVIAFFSGPRY